MTSRRNVIIVIGGQFGSEAKGKHIQDLCHSRPEIRAVVRTGAPNAGHSMAIADGDSYMGAKYVAMQIVPCGWTAKNIEALFIGAGAQIIPDLLAKEVKLVKDNTEGIPIYIDAQAMIQTEEDMHVEVGDGLSGTIGSTGKGCGEAISRRVGRRDKHYKAYKDIEADGFKIWGPMPKSADVARMLHFMGARGEMILVEGTQGCGLSLYHSYYPFCTSRDTGAANWLAEAGLSPMQTAEIHMVCRTYPIRVAGNSGPMADELDWTYFFGKAKLDEKIIDDFNNTRDRLVEAGTDERELIKQVCLSMEEKYGTEWTPFKEMLEFTTVTKLPRRIGEFDYAEFEKAVMMNRPTHVALEFCNYVTAEEYGMKEVTPFMECVAPVEGAPIRYGKMTYLQFRDHCRVYDNPSMRELMNMVHKMNGILEEWCGGHVTHLGISRDATLELTY